MSPEHCQTSSSMQSPEKATAQPDQQQPSPAKTDPPPKDVDPWEAVLEVMTKFDDKQISDWMDDLQNLLTFAGLFSAIVTAFVILSYALLQQDSAGLTATTVQSISQQVASFTVGPGYINSSTSIPNAAAFAPDSLAIKVNTLWMLSLTMSLVASLFDIMVQQWLREYRTPTIPSVREAVRLREMRRQAFTDWAVPAIVSIIPILLELALILFFIGQCQLFAAINNTVFISFAVFLGLALLMFSVASIMPLFFRTCAYKSPSSFALLWLLKGTLTVLSAVVTAGIYLYIPLATWVISRAAKRFFPESAQAKTQILVASASKTFQSFWAKINQPLRRTPINRRSSGSEYWVARERDVLQESIRQAQIKAQSLQTKTSGADKSQDETPADDMLQDGNHLDERALSWVLPWLPREKLSLLKRYVTGLRRDERIRVVVKWIAQTLNTTTRRLRVDRGSDFDFSVLDRIDEHFADVYCDALKDVFPEAWMTASALVERKYGPTVLIILQRIAERPRRTDSAFLSWHTTALMRLRKSQNSLEVDSDSSILRLPTVFLFECSRQFPEAFKEKDLSMLCKWATDRLDDDCRQPDHISNWITFFDILLASAATPLCVVAKQSHWMEDPEIAAGIKEILGGLTKFVTRDKERIRALASNSGKWCTDGVAFATVPAIEAICKSIVGLVSTGHLRQESTCPSQTLVQSLVALFEDQKTFSSASSALQQPDAVPKRSAQSPAEGKDEFLSDPVIPHVGYSPKYMPSSS